MALHDIDKQSDDRANPTPNADDNTLKRDAHETVGTTYRRTGSNVKPTLVMQQGAIQSYDANNLVNMFFGYKPSLNATRPVLRVAKDGFDATTTSADNLVFNSDQNIFKIVSTGTISTVDPGAGNTGTVVVTHGLGYIPIIMAYSLGSTGTIGVPLPIFNGYNSDGTSTGSTYLSIVNTTTFTVTNFKSTSGPANIGTNIKYYLLQETAN